MVDCAGVGLSNVSRGSIFKGRGGHLVMIGRRDSQDGPDTSRSRCWSLPETNRTWLAGCLKIPAIGYFGKKSVVFRSAGTKAPDSDRPVVPGGETGELRSHHGLSRGQPESTMPNGRNSVGSGVLARVKSHMIGGVVERKMMRKRSVLIPADSPIWACSPPRMARRGGRLLHRRSRIHRALSCERLPVSPDQVTSWDRRLGSARRVRPHLSRNAIVLHHEVFSCRGRNSGPCGSRGERCS
jgi:hypothetical protein